METRAATAATALPTQTIAHAVERLARAAAQDRARSAVRARAMGRLKKTLHDVPDALHFLMPYSRALTHAPADASTPHGTHAAKSSAHAQRQTVAAARIIHARYRFLLSYIYANITELTVPQLRFIAWYERSALRLFYGPAFDDERPRLAAEYGTAEFAQLVASTMPRQNGKTTASAIHAACVLLARPLTEGAIISFALTNSRQTVRAVSALMEKLVAAVRHGGALWPPDFADRLAKWTTAGASGGRDIGMRSEERFVLPNGSSLWSRTFDSTTGSSPQFIIVDELSLVHNPAPFVRSILPICINNDVAMILTTTLRTGANTFNRVTSVTLTDDDTTPVIPLLTLDTSTCLRMKCNRPGATCHCYDHLKPPWRASGKEAIVHRVMASVDASIAMTELSGRLDDTGEHIFADAPVNAVLARPAAAPWRRITPSLPVYALADTPSIPLYVEIEAFFVGIDANIGGKSNYALVTVALLPNHVTKKQLLALVGIDAFPASHTGERHDIVVSHIAAIDALRHQFCSRRAPIVVFPEIALSAPGDVLYSITASGVPDVFMGRVALPGGGMSSAHGVPAKLYYKEEMARATQTAINESRLSVSRTMFVVAHAKSGSPDAVLRLLRAQLLAFRRTVDTDGNIAISGKGAAAGANDDIAVAFMLAVYGARMANPDSISSNFMPIR